MFSKRCEEDKIREHSKAKSYRLGFKNLAFVLLLVHCTVRFFFYLMFKYKNRYIEKLADNSSVISLLSQLDL